MSDELLPNAGRRSFLVRSTTLAGAGFLSIALPPALGIGDAQAAMAATPAYTPSIWFTITPDGVTTMHIVKAEMGQHIGTAFAQIIAEELEVPWDKVRLDMPLESAANFGIYGLAYTVNSGSVTTEFDRLSRAGALGRMALVEAGAKLLGAKLDKCYASAGRVIDRASKRSIGYGEILQKVKLEKSFAYPADFKSVKLKDRKDYKVIGKSVPALDIPAKTNGSAKYAMDVFLPNMAYGALAIPRTRHASKVLSVDDSAAKDIPGYLKSVVIPDHMNKCMGWVVALAETYPAALAASKALKIETDAGPYGSLSLDDIKAEFVALMNKPEEGANWVLEGDVEKSMSGADKTLAVEYSSDMICHAFMEPINCTVMQAADGSWHVHVGTQSTSFARMTLTAYLSMVLGKKQEELSVFVHQYLVGGGFGGKQDYDDVLAAAYCAHVLGRPVKFIQSRESQFAVSHPRTPTLHRLKAGIKDGKLAAMSHDMVSGWMGPRFAVGKKFNNGTDWLQLDSWDDKKQDIDQWSVGGSDHWYHVPNHRVRAWNSDRTTWAIQASALRTVSNSYNMFVVESFMDEAAHAAGRDPLEFRLSMLNGKGGNRGIPNTGHPPGTKSDYYLDQIWISLPWPTDKSWPEYESGTVGGALRLANCLRVAARKSGWGSKKLPKNTGMGLAVSSAEERQSPTWVAGVAEVTVDTTTGAYKINKLTIAMDMGIAINPDNVKAQIMGSALWGAGQVLSERLDFENGLLKQSNFHEYKPVRQVDVPEFDIELIESGRHPMGVGEPASTIVAPAVANAIFAATGARVRHLPITPAAVLEALKALKA